MKPFQWVLASTLLTGAVTAAATQDKAQMGILSCDVSRGIGMIVVEKQKLNCVFTNAKTRATENYSGSIEQFGVALGEVKEGHLIWGVLSAHSGPPTGFLAGRYTGVGANASIGVGAGANVLVGGNQGAVSLQPISVEGQTGLNVAGGITDVVLQAAP